MSMSAFHRYKRRFRSAFCALFLAVLAALIWPTGAQAHPLGNFSVNRYSRLEISGSTIYVTYILDMAEIPTLEEKLKIDTDHDTNISDQEREAYLVAKSAEIADHLHLTLGDERLNLENTQPHDHDHDHTHSHMPPGADGGAVSWRSLLALGVSGGLLPCPSALVVMLSAIALGRVGFGLVLIVAFSLGLASVLTAIGMLLVYAHRLFERLPTQGRLLRIVPFVSALVITLLGVAITMQALFQTGVL